MKKLLLILLVITIPLITYSVTDKEYLDLRITYYKEHLVRLQYETILTQQELQKIQKEYQELLKKEQDEKKKLEESKKGGKNEKSNP